MKTPRIVSLDHEKQSYLHYNTKQKKIYRQVYARMEIF